MNIDARAYYERHAGDIGPEKSNGWIRKNVRCPLPGHNDKNPSFGVNLTTGRYKCWACGGGSIYDFEMAISGCNFKTAKKRIDGNTEPDFKAIKERQKKRREKSRQNAWESIMLSNVVDSLEGIKLIQAEDWEIWRMIVNRHFTRLTDIRDILMAPSICYNDEIEDRKKECIKLRKYYPISNEVLDAHIRRI